MPRSWLGLPGLTKPPRLLVIRYITAPTLLKDSADAVFHQLPLRGPATKVQAHRHSVRADGFAAILLTGLMSALGEHRPG